MASIERRVRNGRKTWRAHYRTPAGAQRSKSFARKVDAERFLAGMENSKVVGTYVDPALARVTVGAWAQRWLEGQAHHKPTTRSRYEGIVRKHLHRKWDRVMLANVSHGDVQARVSELTRRHSPATVHKVHRGLARTSTATSPTPRSMLSPRRPATPLTRASTAASTSARNRPTGWSSCSWPVPGSGSARWPRCGSAGSTCAAAGR